MKLDTAPARPEAHSLMRSSWEKKRFLGFASFYLMFFFQQNQKRQCWSEWPITIKIKKITILIIKYCHSWFPSKIDFLKQFSISIWRQMQKGHRKNLFRPAPCFLWGLHNYTCQSCYCLHNSHIQQFQLRKLLPLCLNLFWYSWFYGWWYVLHIYITYYKKSSVNEKFTWIETLMKQMKIRIPLPSSALPPRWKVELI